MLRLSRPVGIVHSAHRFRYLLRFAAVIALLFAVSSSSIARAHSELISSTPQNGETVGQVDSIAFTFAEEVVLEFTTVSLATVTGEEVPLQNPTSDATGTVVTVATVLGALDPGEYTARYYVVSIDGHAVEGSIEFSVAPESTPQPSGSELSPTGSETLSGAVTPTPQPRDLVVSSAGDTSGGGGLGWVWIGTGLAAVAVLGAVSAVLLVAIRRARRGDDV